MLSHGKNRKTQILSGLWLILALVLTVTPVLAANNGSIEALWAVEQESDPGRFNVTARVRAEDRISNSNLYYQVFDSSGITVLTTHSTSLDRMESGDQITDTWIADLGAPIAEGQTVDLCWSTGGSTNCNIDQAETLIQTIPTLGNALSLLGVGLLGLWFWHRRGDFAMGVK